MSIVEVIYTFWFIYCGIPTGQQQPLPQRQDHTQLDEFGRGWTTHLDDREGSTPTSATDARTWDQNRIDVLALKYS